MRIAIDLSAALPSDEIIRFTRGAEERGFESVWIGETRERDPIPLLGALARATNTIKLATGIVNVYARSPANVVMSTATLDELSSGRVILGLGTSTPIIIGWHGHKFEKPLTRVREFIRIVRRAFDGERVEQVGQTLSVKDFKLGFKPVRTKIPIFIAALGSRMLRLGGEIADGVLLNIVSPEYVKEAVEQVRKGAEASGRSLSDIEIASFLPVCLNKDGAKSAAALKKVIAYYLNAPFYGEIASHYGFESDVKAVRANWATGDREKTLASVSDELLNSVAYCGTNEGLLLRLAQYKSAGLTLPVLNPCSIGVDYKESIERCLQAL